MNVMRNSVKLIQGRLTGVQDILPNGKSFLSFKGIPYAQPPVGKLRFFPPNPLQKFNEDPLDCSDERDMCLQNDMITNEKSGSEDCLFLNVYAPQANHAKTKFPVMLFLHGGGFSTGNGNGNLYSPEYLVQEDVIVVTCNYRLGPFGYLYLPKAGMHGNAGLYDQLLALQWINENIIEFNGDPNNVTLFGESAGGVSATIHFMSPISRKYIHKVISQSGTVFNDWAIQVNPQGKAKQLASSIGCKSQSDKEIFEFLRNADANEILKLSKKTALPDENARGLRFPFKPVVEANSEDSIFKQFPNENMKLPDNRNIPIMLGYNSLEGMILFPKLKQVHADYDKDYTKLVPLTMNVVPESETIKAVGKEIKEFYFGDKPINESTIGELVLAMGDGQFVNGFQFYAEFLKQYQKDAPIYYYRFAVDDELNIFKKIQKIKMKGACHADELFYLFKSNWFDPELEPTSNAAIMRHTMCKMWTNFAKYGDPTPDHDKSMAFKWKPLNENNVIANYDTLEIGNNKIEMVPNLDRARFEFWKKLYTKVNGSILKPKL